ncbi:MAG TPA: hypothetical protein DIU15_07940 [Deltaproteobacteria bacterium]|nr:hypothetical protein [Deltaproteobacteria bacterium]
MGQLRQRSEALAGLPEGPQREEVVRKLLTESKEVGNHAIAAHRADLTARIGQMLIDVNETKFAEAFLQRSVGLLKPAEHGKDAMYPLAQVRRASGRPLEAASLYERAIDIEPTMPAEFVGLSDLYLAAGRMGPARAAVTRGLARHKESVDLAVQGAKVALLDGKAPEAATSLRTILQSQRNHVGAQLVFVEALLATGALAEASREAEGLRADFPEDPWGWIFGGAVLRATGELEEGSTMLARATELAGDCPCTHEERLTIAWASELSKAPQVAPRARTEIPNAAPTPPKTSPSTGAPG